jgi:hypothetical protein
MDRREGVDLTILGVAGRLHDMHIEAVGFPASRFLPADTLAVSQA